MTIGWSRAQIGVAAALSLGLSFALGYFVRNSQPIGLTIYTASGQVGADVASFQVGDTWYDFRTSVAWTDQAGAEHPDGWPDCLPRLQSVQGVRFGGAVIWHDDTGYAQVLWVDCRASGQSQVALTTQPSGSLCMQAITVGVLVSDPESGVGLGAASGPVQHVRWPSGWTAREEAGSIALVDANGAIVAHVGDTVSMGGGIGSGGDWFVCPPVQVVAPSPT